MNSRIKVNRNIGSNLEVEETRVMQLQLVGWMGKHVQLSLSHIALVYLKKGSLANEISTYIWSIARGILDPPDFSCFLQRFTMHQSPSLTFSDTALDSEPFGKT